MKVLVAEDQPMVLKTIAYKLHKSGFETVAAIDGMQAKDFFKLERPDLVIAIVNERSEDIIELADHVICIPATVEQLSPFLTSIPLQLLSYYIAKMRGCNVDQPRNLAKSVTVE